jgi:hypothetical protein
VWLPLPHLINVLPAQVDLFYRTGLFASLVSVLCLGLSVWAVARLVVAITGSRAGATVRGAVARVEPEPALSLHHADDRALAPRGVVSVRALAIRVGAGGCRSGSGSPWPGALRGHLDALRSMAGARDGAGHRGFCGVASNGFARDNVAKSMATVHLARSGCRHLRRQQPDHDWRMVRHRRVLRSRPHVSAATGADDSRDLVGNPPVEWLCDRVNRPRGQRRGRACGHARGAPTHRYWYRSPSGQRLPFPSMRSTRVTRIASAT